MGGGSPVVEGQRPELTASPGERLVAGSLAVMAVLAFVLLARDNPVWLAIGTVFAGVLAFGAIKNHRGLMAIGFFLCAFGPWRWLTLFGAPYIAASAFLLWRANRLDNTV